MFEPLKDLLAPHAEDLKSYLASIECRLGELVENAQSTVEYDQFTTRSDRSVVGEDGTAIIELSPSEGFSWHITRVALTSSEKGNCAVYVGSVAPENLVDVFRESKMATDRGRYFVPRGIGLIFHFYEQEPGHIVTANVQAEQLIPVVKQKRTVTGRSSEAANPAPNRPNVPSGLPYAETPVAGH